MYNGAGAIIPLVVTVPNAPSQTAPGSPTGVMFNGSATDFLLAPGKRAIFMWVTEDGTISGWNPGVQPTTAVIKVDHSQVHNAKNGAVFKGATLAEIDGKRFILAANFREWERSKLFYFHLALGESAVLGALCAQDLGIG